MMSSFEDIEQNSSVYTPHSHLTAGRASGQAAEACLVRSHGQRLWGLTICSVIGDIFVNCVWKHGPAYMAGVRFGDQIVRVDGVPVKVCWR